ncbi:MAG: Lrp/AsnC ligand binding domain-containing protein [Armatimonadota bacterium]
MVQSYILIETEPGRIKEIVDELTKMKEVKSVCGVTGPYDVIACAETENMDILGDLIMKKVQKISGIRKTMSCLCTYCALCK